MAGLHTAIVAADYNQIQSNIGLVLGNGSSDTGYGQTVNSSQVSAKTAVTSQQWQKLRADILNALWHQTGVDNTGALTFPTNNNTITESDRNQYLVSSQQCVVNKLTTPPSTQASRSSFGFGDVVRSASWNGTIQHVVTISFPSHDAARFFFNTGSRIELSATQTGTFSGTSNSKDLTWQSMFTGMGTVYLKAHSTTCTGTGNGSSVGFYELNNVYSIIFVKPSPANPVAYSVNDYVIQAKYDGAGVLTLNVQFQDTATGYTDENVDGITTSIVQAYYASGSYVSVPLPPASSTALG
jgi:hypothetical protein